MRNILSEAWQKIQIAKGISGKKLFEDILIYIS